MKRIIISIIGSMILLLNCASSKKQVATLDNPDYLIGEWVFIRYVHSPVGRFDREQFEEIISTDLIITKDSIYFKNKIDFIENCGDYKWQFTKTTEADVLNLKEKYGEDAEGFIRIRSNCYEELSPKYLKEDTLISFNGGIVTYRVKVATTGS